MTIYHEQARDLPIAGEYDVIVTGAGPAGVSAALEVAQGAKKLCLLSALSILVQKICMVGLSIQLPLKMFLATILYYFRLRE